MRRLGQCVLAYFTPVTITDRPTDWHVQSNIFEGGHNDKQNLSVVYSIIKHHDRPWTWPFQVKLIKVKMIKILLKVAFTGDCVNTDMTLNLSHYLISWEEAWHFQCIFYSCNIWIQLAVTCLCNKKNIEETLINFLPSCL